MVSGLRVRGLGLRGLGARGLGSCNLELQKGSPTPVLSCLNPKPWVLPISNSWIVNIIWLYTALNRAPNIDYYWVGEVPNLNLTLPGHEVESWGTQNRADLPQTPKEKNAKDLAAPLRSGFWV